MSDHEKDDIPDNRDMCMGILNLSIFDDEQENKQESQSPFKSLEELKVPTQTKPNYE
jgi:hypothetical protein